MNETVRTIHNRRSMRGFKPEQLDRAAIDVIIDCGLRAPSAMNTQGWHFTVVQNTDLITRMNRRIRDVLPDTAKERYLARNNGDPDFSIFYFAPTVVFVSALANGGSSAVDAALATQNICLAAESMDIGSCIIGLAMLLFDTEDGENYKRELGIPEGYEPLHAISLGYKDKVMAEPARLPDKVNYIL